MAVLFVIMGASLLVALGFLFAFIMAVKRGQYDDTYTPKFRVLFEDNPRKKENRL